MILKRALKKVMVTAAVALACLQSASCLKESDIAIIKAYADNRRSSLGREISLRRNYFKKFRALNSNAQALNSQSIMEEDMEIEKTNMNSIMENFETFKKMSDNLIVVTDNTMDIYSLLNNPNFTRTQEQKESCRAQIEKKEDIIREKISYILTYATLLNANIGAYDSHMMEVIAKYSETEKITSEELKNLTLFKLAQSQKIVPANIIYALSKVGPFELENETEKEKIMGEISENVRLRLISNNNVETFVDAIKKDVVENNINIFVSASTHFHLLFDIYSPMSRPKSSLVDDATMSIYLDLLRSDFCDVYKYINITPVQVMKIITIEYLLSGYLMDYQNNSLFFILGKIIENVFEPQHLNSRNDEEDARMGREKQDKILDVLSTFWESSESAYLPKKAAELYDEIGIEYFDFIGIQSDFKLSRWIYDGTSEILDNIRMPSSMTYTHPLWYVCKREKYIDYLDGNVYGDLKLFVRTKTGDVVFMPPTIYTSVSAYWEIYIEKCIRSYIYGDVQIIKKKDGSGVYATVADFSDFFKNIIQEENAEKRENETSTA
ncbi:hypothetical protein NEMIN01_0355 [Nematocida minor]|uniref:uncharacterized protein n=1 Tax=Nematocida minor TaxID=1912983 RepID=UPI00221E7B21|nr:uncharacterized protein NEMIN01_0355 [Nematocida minor]KAI5189189.1 hypothetical protein NEMIN01_0355 [Nematocida minor]